MASQSPATFHGSESLVHEFGVLEKLRNPVIAADLEARITFWNEGAGLLYGYAAKEVLGRELRVVFPDEEVALDSALQRVKSDGWFETELCGRCLSGAECQTRLSLSLMKDPSGEPVSILCVATDVSAHKQTEQALRQSEERYLLAEWATSDGLWDWNPVTDESYFSPRFKALLGFGEDELSSKTADLFRRMHPDDEATLYEAVRLHFEEGRPYDVEIRVRLKDDTYRWFRTRGKAVRNAAGEVVRMVGSMRDIQDRKKAEEAAREQDEQLRLMIDSIEQLAWMAEADGSVYWYNQQWYEYTGTTFEQMQGWGWQSVHDPRELPETLQVWGKTIREGQALDIEFSLRGADGVFRPFLVRIVPVRGADGKVAKWFGTHTNIESLKREQELLKESERRFRELAERVPEMIWLSDANGMIHYWNPQLYAYSGYAPGEGMADKWVSLLHPDDAPQLVELWQKSVVGKHLHEHEARMRRHDGVYRWFLHRAEPVLNEEGEVVKWIGTSVDIHEQKLTEQALRRSNEDLEQFAYAASHDLQEPLRTVSIYSELLARKYGSASEDAGRFASYIVNAAARMDSLLKGILAYSRVDETAGYGKICDMRGVLKQALGNLEAALSESGAKVKQGELPSVVCHETHLVQLFQNLMANAIKYRSDRPLEIEVSAVRGQRWHTFSVADNGIGIRPEYIGQIFGMFRRLHGDKYPGIGVGLAICKRIVERHGGKIWAESDGGLGTRFCFTLQAAE